MRRATPIPASPMPPPGTSAPRLILFYRSHAEQRNAALDALRPVTLLAQSQTTRALRQCDASAQHPNVWVLGGCVPSGQPCRSGTCCSCPTLPSFNTLMDSDLTSAFHHRMLKCRAKKRCPTYNFVAALPRCRVVTFPALEKFTMRYRRAKTPGGTYFFTVANKGSGLVICIFRIIFALVQTRGQVFAVCAGQRVIQEG